MLVFRDEEELATAQHSIRKSVVRRPVSVPQILLFIVLLFVFWSISIRIFEGSSPRITVRKPVITKRKTMKRRILWQINSSPDKARSNAVLSIN